MSTHESFDTIEDQLSCEGAVLPRRTLDIAPLERFEAPPHLDGSTGTHRCKDTCCIDAADDVAAVEWWVWRTSNNETTARCRRSAMEKLLNWACFARGKAVSSLDEEDFVAFARFLAHPEPLHRWIGSRQPRESAAWRPFIKPLTGASRTIVLKHTASFIRWLSQQRYADLRFIYGKAAMDEGRPILAGDVPVTLHIPRWANFSFPEQAGAGDA